MTAKSGIIGTLAISMLALVAAPAYASAGGGVAFQVSSLPQQVRYEGLTETVGAIVAQATFAGTVKSGSSISIVYGATITNLGSGNLNNVVSGTIGGTPYGPGANPNITVAVSGNTVTLQVTADSNLSKGDYIVISQVRVNVNALGAGTTTISATATGTSAQPTVYPITFTQATVPVASIVNPSLGVTLTATSNQINTCSIATPVINYPFERGRTQPAFNAGWGGVRADARHAPAGSPGEPTAGAGTFTVVWKENYPAAITSLTDESSFTPSFPPANGTQVIVTVSNVPAGLAVYFDTADSYTDGGSSYNVDLTKAFQVSTGAPLVFTSVANTTSTSTTNSATTFFEVGLPNAAGTAFMTGSIAPLGATISIQATVSLGPVQAASAGPVSFAANIEGGPTTVATVGDCVSNLLFPFLTNQVGFDTTVTISNTTANALAFGSGVGASPQSGSCALTFYPTDLTTQTGTSAGTQGTVSTFTTPSIAAGGVYSLQQSTSSFAGQSGYMFAVCRFLDAHGFSFVLNGNASTATISQGLLALVIQNGSNRLPAANYESLGH